MAETNNGEWRRLGYTETVKHLKRNWSTGTDSWAFSNLALPYLSRITAINQTVLTNGPITATVTRSKYKPSLWTPIVQFVGLLSVVAVLMLAGFRTAFTFVGVLGVNVLVGLFTTQIFSRHETKLRAYTRGRIIKEVVTKHPDYVLADFEIDQSNTSIRKAFRDSFPDLSVEQLVNKYGAAAVLDSSVHLSIFVYLHERSDSLRSHLGDVNNVGFALQSSNSVLSLGLSTPEKLLTHQELGEDVDRVAFTTEMGPATPPSSLSEFDGDIDPDDLDTGSNPGPFDPQIKPITTSTALPTFDGPKQPSKYELSPDAQRFGL